MKKKLIIIFGVILLILGLVFIYLNFIKKNDIKTDAIKFKEEYTLVSDDNIFVYKTGEEIKKILESGTGIVYLGFPECPWCQAYVKILNEIAKEEGVKKIYYFNIKEDRSNNTKIYQDIVSLIGDNLDYDEEGNYRIYVPDVTFILNGKIVGHNNETSMISGEIKPDEYWTDEKETALKETLRKYIIKTLDGMCTSCS